MSTKAKEKPIIATFLIAIIIGLVCLIIFTLKYYQPQLELPPKLVLKNDSGKEIELLLVSYDWTYKGENKKYDIGVSGDNIVNHNFDTKNIWFGDYDDIILGYNDNLKVKTVPAFKNNGFTTTSYRYDFYMTEPSIDTNIIGAETEFEPLINSDYVYLTYTLNSDAQGTATYAFKFINTGNMNLEKLKTLNSSSNAEEIKAYLKECPFGVYLNDAVIENNKIKITYKYWVYQEFTDDIACALFATIDSVNEIEFDFAYDKFVKSEWNLDTRKYDYTPIEKLEPHIYKRDGFETFQKVVPQELKDYMNK